METRKSHDQIVRNYGTIEDGRIDSPADALQNNEQGSVPNQPLLLVGVCMVALLLVPFLAFPMTYYRYNVSTDIYPTLEMDNLASSSPTTIASNPAVCTFTNVPCDTTDSTGRCYILPTEYEACMNHIILNVNHTVQSIRSLDHTFQQSYVFYDIARDPVASWPQDHEAHEFGYTLYGTSDDNGRVDVHSRLQNIERSIMDHDKATVTTFWNVEQVFRSLRDAHVTALPGNLGSLTSDFFSGRYAMEVLPERVLLSIQNPNKSHIQLRTKFYYKDQDENLQLVLEWIDNDESQETIVDTVNDMAPLDFLLTLARSPVLSTQLKSTGPRINALASFHFPSISKDYAFFWTGRRGYKREHVAPSDVLPGDSFLVKYKDGTSERFYARIVLDSIDYPGHSEVFNHSMHDILTINISSVQEKINEATCLYRNFLAGTRIEQEIDEKSNSLKASETRSTSERSDGRQMKVLNSFCDISNDGWFDKTYNCSDFSSPYNDDGPLEAAYRKMNGYILFKLDSFDAPPWMFISLWKELQKVAKKEGMHRLMIDISNNGGGEVPAGLNLARLMYPEVECEFFENKYDIVYSQPMHIWATLVNPILSELRSPWFEEADDTTANDHLLINLLQSATKDKRKMMVGIAKSMCIFDLDREQNYCGDVDIVKKNCTLLSLVEHAFESSLSLKPFRQFLKMLFHYMEQSNPWTINPGFDVSISVEFESYKRGGVMTNFTRFLDHEPDRPWWNCSQMHPLPNAFSDYILVGNGNSGSTANTFASTVEGIWKNRNRSGATRPLTTVSYGGIPDDTPLTQFAGGTVTDRINAENALVGLAGLHLLCLLLGDTNHGKIAKEAFRLLQETLPQVPFYFQQFPRLTAVEIYNKFMLPNAMPLEYVKMPPDEYIPQMYFGSIFVHPERLQELYDIASQQFSTR